MAINIAHILNEPISYASVTHADLKSVFDKFKKILKKISDTGILTVEDNPADKLKVTISFIDRNYDICFSSGYVENVFLGKIAAWRKLENSRIEIGSVSFNSRKARITDPLTKAEGSLHEPHFCRILVYAWILKDTGWNIGQLNKSGEANDQESGEEAGDLSAS